MSDQTRRIGDILQNDIEATVKFFDPQKGFGFVELCTGGEDAYLPAAILEEAGYRSLKKGTVVFCEVRFGQRGAEVSAIHFVDLVTGGGDPINRNGGPSPALAREGGSQPPSRSGRRRSSGAKSVRKKEEPAGSGTEPAAC